MKKNLDKSPRKRLLKGLLVASLILILLAASTFVFRVQILTAIADFLIVDDHPLPAADMIFVLNGDHNTRPFLASDLYQQGYAPLIGIAQCERSPAEELGLVYNETDISVGVMQSQGVPLDKIIILPVEGGATSTFDEAVALRGYIQQSSNIRRVIIVTSSFHTRRSKWVFEKELSGLPVVVEMAASPNWGGFDETNWWDNEQGLISLNNEYIKLVYYFFKYR